MNFNFKIDIPKETAKVSPKKVKMKMSYGIITRVIITIPDGQKETAKLRIKYHGAQLYPLNRAEWYKGDGNIIDFEDRFPLLCSHTSLKQRVTTTQQSIHMRF